MAQCSVVILVAVTLQAICFTTARPHISKKHVLRLKEVAAQWKEVINSEKNPCNDFYGYLSCSKSYSTSGQKDTGKAIKEILIAKPEEMTAMEKKFVNYTSHCDEITPTDKDEFIKSFKFDFIGSWPAFEENWDESKFNLPLAIAEMNSYNYPVIFKYEFTRLTDPFVIIFQIRKEKLVDISLKKELLKKKFEILGVRNPEKVFADAAFLEKTLKEAAETVQWDTDHRIKFSELKDHCPEMNWEEQMMVTYAGMLPDDYPVILKSHENLKNIYTTVSKLSPRVVANYFFCVFVETTNNMHQIGATTLFMPVVKEAILKHLYSESTKDVLKDLYVKIVEGLSQIYDFETHKTAEELIRFINEDVFGNANEDDLANEFKKITNDQGCMTNYHHLQQLRKRRAKRFLYHKNALENDIKYDLMAHLVYETVNVMNQPWAFKFESLVLGVVHAAISPYIPYMNVSEFTNTQWECLTKQFKEEAAAEREMDIVLVLELIFKIFEEWTKNHPNILQEENKILEEYGLSTEKLLFVSLAKKFCTKPTYLPIIMNAFATATHCWIQTGHRYSM